MSEKKLTPAEVWEHVKALWPDAESFVSYYGWNTSISIRLPVGRAFSVPMCIDWPEGVNRWPPAEKPRRPAKMPEDYGKPVWFCDDALPQAIKALLDNTRPPVLVDISNESKAIFWSSDDPLETMCIDNITGIKSDGAGGFEYLDSNGDGWNSCVAIVEQEKPSEEPKWITPTNEHIGQAVHARNYADYNWRVCTLAYVDEAASFFVSTDDCVYRFARILNPKYKG